MSKRLYAFFALLCSLLLVPVAWADADLEINTPAIAAIRVAVAW